MAKLYPPELSSKLPAFCNNYDINNNNEFQGTTIKIPFSIRRQFNTNTIASMRIRIRTTSTNTYLVEEYDSIQCDFKNGIAVFSFSSQTKLFNEGQFYRVQVAFVDKITKKSGYYSEVSIIKCITKPVAKIGNSNNNTTSINFSSDNNFYSSGNINTFDNKFLGVYIQDTSFGDTSEKAYSYIFNIYDSEENLLLTSNSQVHNTINDVNSDISYDFWQILTELEESEIYFIEYIVTTINGYVVSSPKYKITKTISIPVVYKINLRVSNNEEEGYIDINFDVPITNNKNLQQVYYLLLSNDEIYDDTTQYFIKVEKTIFNYEKFTGNLLEWNQEILNQNLYKKENEDYILVTLNEIYDETKIYYIKVYDKEYDYQEFNGDKTEWLNYLNANNLYKALKSDVIGEEPYTGNFLILRTSSESNFSEWITITKFAVQNQLLSTIHYKDQTVQQGIEYQYALQQFNIYNIKSKKILQSTFNPDTNEEEEDTIVANFEHIYISDGEKQLKISLNPKINSLKYVIPETKVETIGSKFPFIFRNGSVSYQEFGISGLISYQTDLAKLFLTEEEYKSINMLEYKSARMETKPDISYGYFDENGYHIVNDIENAHEDYIYFKLEKKPVYDLITKKLLYTQRYYVMCRKDQEKPYYKQYNITENNLSKINYLDEETTTVKVINDLTTENVLAERYFRQKVLEWLNDGKVKLFRSPTEGNLLVRILNVSMVPEERLGRLIYTFSATISEIDYLNYENLLKYDIIKSNSTLNYEDQWVSVNVRDKLQDENKQIDKDGFILMNIEGITINSVIINHFAPGDQIKIEYDEDNNLNGTIYTIGTTGSLDLNNDDRKIVRLWLKINELTNNYNDFEREVTYSYTSTSVTDFDAIAGVDLSTEVAEQFIGPKNNILEPYNLQYKCYGVPDQNGDVKDPFTEEEGISNVYRDLLSHSYINYNIKISNDNNSSNVEKYGLIQVDMLHAWKRDIIPIFAYNTEIINSNTQFGFTPFNKGYVNNKNILNYLEYGTWKIKYTSYDNNINDYSPVLKENPQTNNLEDTGLVSVYDIVTLGRMVDARKQQALSIFKVFIFDLESNEWIPSTTPGFKYYDNYHKSWWEGNEEYDASFTINEMPIVNNYYLNPYNEEKEEIIDRNIIGDNKIYLNDIENITLYNLGTLSKITIGNGVVLELTYQKRTTNYDLEGIDYKVLTVKQEYNDLLENSEEQLNNVLDIFYNKEQLEAQQALINSKLNIVKVRLGLEDHEESYNVTQDAALKRVIEQKQILWYNRSQAVFEITDYLKSFQLYTDIDILPPINILKGYTLISDPEEVNNEITEINQMTKQITSNELDENILFSENTTKNLSFTELPFPVKEIEGKFYNYIDKEYYIDIEYYKKQKDKYEEIIDNYESQIVELQSQQGALIGGFDINNYNDETLPQEGTLIYYDYMINEVDQSYGTELLKLSQAKAKLVNDLLSRNYNEVNNLLALIQNSTTEYIKSNANALIKLLQNYVNRANYKLNQIKSLSINDIGKIIFNIDNDTEFQLNSDQQREIEYILTDKLNNIYKTTESNTSTIVYLSREGIKCIQNKDNVGRIISSTYEDMTKTQIYTYIGQLFEPQKTLENLYNEISEIASSYKVLLYLEQNVPNLKSYCKNYELYGLTLQNQVETWSNLINILQDVEAHPGDEGRNYNKYYSNSTYDETNNFNEQIVKIRETFVNNTNTFVNEWLINNEYNLDSLLPAMQKTLEYQLLPTTTEYNENNEYYIRQSNDGIVKYKKFNGTYEEWNYYLIHNKLYKAIVTNLESNEEAFAILDLFTDYVNSSQINTIKNALNQYYPAVPQDDTKLIVQKIKNNDILYAEKIDKLDKIKLVYLENKEIIQNEIDNLETEITKLQNEQNEYRKKLKEANEKLNFAALSKDIRDDLDLSDVPYTTGYFFDKILIPNSYIVNNLYLIGEYLNWVQENQNLLIYEVGQIDDTIHTGEQYGKFLKNYMDMYEIEAFDFLHKYDSIIEDLGHGYDNVLIDNLVYSPGVDKYIYDLSHYYFNVYKDILYLFDDEVDPSSSNKFLSDLISQDESVRENAYKELESYIYKICFGKEIDDNSASSIVTIYVGVLLSPDGTKDQLIYFPNISNSLYQSHYYPEIRTFGKNTQTLTNGNSNGNKILANGYKLLRYPIEENRRMLFDVPYNNSTEMYYIDPFQTDTLYYLKNGSTVSNLKLAFDREGMSPEEFDAEVKKYKSIGEDLVWMSEDAPVICSMNLHKFLYDCDIKNIEISNIQNLDYYEKLGLIINPNDKFLLKPQKYYNYFKNFLGKIVHDVPSEGTPIYWPKPTDLIKTTEDEDEDIVDNEEENNENEEENNENEETDNNEEENNENEETNNSIISFDDYGIPVGENITQDELEALGYIYNYGDEYGSYQGILEADITAFNLIASYFYAYKSLYIIANREPDNPNDKEYIKVLIRYLLKIQNNLEDFKNQLKYWDNVINHSENIVLKEYQLLGMKDNDDEMIQLREIISNAYDKKQYYEELQLKWSIELNNLLKYNDILADYFQAKKAADTVLKDLASNKNKTSINCGIYYKKCDHYLKLLFNKQPFNYDIDQEIISNKEILKINDNDTLTYNFGIAYSLEKYKKFVGDIKYSEVDFSKILLKARDFEEKFYKYFPLLEPIKLQGSLESVDEFNNIDINLIKTGYIYKITDNIITENFAVTSGDYLMAEINTNNTIIWKVIKSSDTNFKSNYCLTEMDNGTYLPYTYLNEETWDLDVSSNKLYFTYFPNLKDFVNYQEYFKVNQDNNLEQYDANKKYYLYIDQQYKPITISDEEQFKNYKQVLYFQGNGGLRRILHDLIGLDYHHPHYSVGHSFLGRVFRCRDNKYIENIQTIYRGSLKLYNNLLQQIQTDEFQVASIQRLNELKSEYETQLKDIKEDLEKLQNSEIDQNEIIQNIYYNFAKYLYVLTMSYLQGS